MGLKKTHAILLLAAVLMLCACNEGRRRTAFQQNDGIRLQVGGTVHFTYNPLTCQLAFSRDRKEFRAQTDNTSDYYVVTLSEIPSNEGDKVTADLIWTTETSILKRTGLTLEAVRIEDETIWLWNSSGQIGVTVKLLD